MYAKLIFRNVKRSSKDYLIYIVTMTICVTLFYGFLSITSRFYHPPIPSEYEYSFISDEMKMAICAVTLLLLFLIRYVNHYMMLRKQKEFAVYSLLGMERKTVAWLFFAETFLLGMVSVAAGIFLGIFFSQFITGMLLSAYGQEYRLSFMLFSDTVLLTIGFFAASLFAVGFLNVRSIKKVKIIDMLYAERQNEPPVKKSRYMPRIAMLYTFFLAFMAYRGILKMYYYSDPRFPLPVHIMFWGNILAPLVSALLGIAWLFLRRKWNFHRYLSAAAILSLINAGFAASVPPIQSKYYLSSGPGTLNTYLMFLLVDVTFLICCVIYLAGNLITCWKEKSPGHKYRGSSLFFFGQIISKLNTTSRTMTLICLTLVLSVFLFVSAPALTGWALGFLEVRAFYDIQISSRYNNVYEEADLPRGDYPLVTAFLDERNILTSYDCTYSLYLPQKSQFHNRQKLDFPIVAISLSDYNALREMLGYEQITLKEDEFSTQWNTLTTEEERKEFLENHTTVETDHGTLKLASNACYSEAVGETVYNSYTDVMYIFPDNVCKNLLSVMRNRYIMTDETIPYHEAIALENAFTEEYPEQAAGEYYIRTRSVQVSGAIADTFVLQATMTYSAVVLLIICFTILSLQQLLDNAHYRYRFGVLRKLGVEEDERNRLILKQLAVWFGLPISVAAFVSILVTAYFFETISLQISAYIGTETLLAQVGTIACILLMLLFCYFATTWILFKKSIEEKH